MNSKIIETEIKYIECFSRKYETKDFIRFHDKHLEEMYALNITKIKNYKDTSSLNSLIKNEILYNSKNKKEFLIIDFDEYIDLENINIKPDFSYELLFMTKNINELEDIKLDANEKIIRAESFHDFEDILNLNILDKGKIWGEEFTSKRTFRKIDVYHKNKILQPFIFYINNKAVGFCEIFINNDFAKIEDFYLLDNYRNKGYGKKLLNYVMKYAESFEVDFVYIVTDNKEKAKEFYKKCGFKEEYKKTQIIYEL